MNRLEPPVWLTEKGKDIWNRKISWFRLKSPDRPLSIRDANLLAIWCDTCAEFSTAKPQREGIQK